jgi:NADH:ubiquinone oxidoreductase subunit 4 (subunit M)
MSLVVLGIFSFNVIGLEGAILQSVSHGFVASALFFLVGILYERYHSRLVLYYGGLTYTMPLYAASFLFFTMSNIAFPGTSSFIGEFLLLLGTFKFNVLCALIGALSVIFSGAYSL